MADKAPQCWSCWEFLQGGGISLDGSNRPHVCMTCWKKIPVYRRVQIMLAAMPQEQGGLGLRATIEALINPMTWNRRN